jgi:Zn-dependent M28 family amino/carboxypeptidase
MKKLAVLLFSMAAALFFDQEGPGAEMQWVLDKEATMVRLQKHLRALTVDIGERSIRRPENLKKTEQYILSFYRDLGVSAHTEPYSYKDATVANVVADIIFKANPSVHFLVGAHYDSLSGTVGADDNASAVAVQLETARQLAALKNGEEPDLAVRFASFALEEPPVFDSPYMGSRLNARNARRSGEKIDGMICLEMVGYTCHEPGCQRYPFPLMFLEYPETGEFIGIVGNLGSRGLTRSLGKAFKRNPELPVITLTVPLGGWLMPSIRLSDHSAFWAHGFKAVMITDSAFYRNPHYHRPSDTMEKLDYRFMAELVESLVLFFRTRQRAGRSESG